MGSAPPPRPLADPSGDRRRSHDARRNPAGIAGLTMVAVGTICSPAGFLGITLPLLMLIGFGGMVIAAVSLAWRPRWPGAAGLLIGTICIGFWIAFFASAFMQVQASASALGLTVPQHAQMCISAMVLTEAAESQRAASGAPAATVDLAAVDPGDRIDPWGRPYRYVLVRSPRGFTFISDGVDGVAGTADDLDALSIQRLGMFELPPVTIPPPGAAPPVGS